MKDVDYSAASEFLAAFFAGTEHQVEIRALPNEQGEGRPFPTFTREPAVVEMHCQRFDGPERAVYFGVCTRRAGGGKGKREDCVELPALWVDIDIYKQAFSKDDAISALLSLRFQPSVIIDSGGGIHAYWLLREPITLAPDTDEGEALRLEIEAALHQLAYVLAGDHTVCDIARIMRLPATHNTKDGSFRLCTVLPCSTWTPIEYADLVDDLDDLRQLLVPTVAPTRKAKVIGEEDDPFLALSRKLTFNAPLDIEAELAAMTVGSCDEHNIRNTQLRVSLSMAQRGFTDDEIVSAILLATERAAADAGVVNWSWGRERKTILKRLSDGIKRFDIKRGERRPVAQGPATVIEMRTRSPIQLSPEAAMPDDDGEAEQLPSFGAQDKIAELITLFNTRYMVVNEDGRAIVYEPTFDARLNRRYFLRILFDDLKRFHMNRRMVAAAVEDAKGKKRPIVKTTAEIWLEHPNRREYLGGVVFDPSGSSRPGTLNLWQGFAVGAAAGSWESLKAHIFDVICAGNLDHFAFLLGWMARLAQFPAEQGEVAVVLKGGEGAGKGTLARALLRVLGQHGLAISNAKHLTGTFNGHLRDTVFLFADEAFWAGDKQHVGVLKALITEPFLTIEAKYQNPVQMPNFVHLMMASNEDWVVPASLDARRFFVLEVLNNRANDHAYFDAIWVEMEAGGFEAMLFDLLNYDLSSYNHRSVPTTVGLQEQRKLSLAGIDEWWRDVLYRGYVFRSRLGLEEVFHTWHSVVSMELLYSSYSSWAKDHHERRPVSREWLGRYLVKQGAELFRPLAGWTGEHMVNEANQLGGTSRKAAPVEAKRPHGYDLGGLEQARRAFGATTGLTIAWEADTPPDAGEPPF